jgi:hypothetical protein
LASLTPLIKMSLGDCWSVAGKACMRGDSKCFYVKQSRVWGYGPYSR